MPIIQHKRFSFSIPAFFLSLALLFLISCAPEGDSEEKRQVVKRSLSDQRIVHIGSTTGSIMTEVGYWSLDNNVFDHSGEENHGTITGTTDYVVGVKNEALQFDGSTFVDLGDTQNSVLNFEWDKSFSVSAWIKKAVDDEKMMIIGKMEVETNPKRGWAVFSEVDNTIVFNLRHQPGGASNGKRAKVASTLTIAADQAFHHVAVTYDGKGASTGVHIYIDGNESTEVIYDDLDQLTTITQTPTNIGARDQNADNNAFQGVIDEVFVFKGVLDEGQVAYLNDNPTEPLRPAILFWGDLDHKWGQKAWAPYEIPGEFKWGNNWGQRNWAF